MEIKSLLKSWSRESDIKDLSLDDRGIWIFSTEAKFYVSIESDLRDEGLFIYSVIGNVPSDREAETALFAIKANLFGKETGRSSLGYDEQTQTLVLYKYVPFEFLTDNNFSEQIDEFLAYRTLWSQKIDSPIIDTPKTEKSITSSLRETMQKENVRIFFA